jgi:hypothetical protein
LWAVSMATLLVGFDGQPNLKHAFHARQMPPVHETMP